MKLTRQQKKDNSAMLAKIFKTSPSLYFTEYKGLKFQELADLRAKLRPHKCKYQIVKNSLVRHALKQAGIESGEQKLLNGPLALLVAPGADPITPARVLANFAKEFPNLKIKAGFVDSRWLDAAECKKLAALGSRGEILGHLAGTLYSAVGQGAWILAAPIRDLVLVLQALENKKSAAASA